MWSQSKTSIRLAALLIFLAPAVGRSQAAPPAIPSPEELLEKASAELAKGPYSFHAEIGFDDVLISGQKLRYAGAADFTVRPPNAVYVDYRDDLSAKRLWSDGKTITLLDVPSAKYSRAAAPGDLDTTADLLKKRYDLTLPLADLVSNDLFKRIESHAHAWGYIGVHDVEGTPAHHIAIRGENADLQLWIQKTGKPLILKLVLTYTNVPTAPQYEAILMDWKLGAEVSDATFAPVLPEGAQQIEFAVSEGAS